MQLQRRQFLMLAGSAAGAGWLQSQLIAEESARKLQTVRQTARALGTSVTITALHENVKTAATAVHAAFAELEVVESLMSIYRPESQLSQLNQNGRLDDPHPYLVAVLEAAADMSRRTAGAFDITVQPLWQLYQQAQQQNTLPTPRAIQQARQQVDWRRLEVNPGSVRFLASDTRVTLNGIAQGFAADAVSAVIQRHGVRHVLVDTGEFAGRGTNSLTEPWTIGIQHPRQEESYLALARLTNRCLSTSGDYATTFSADRKHHHIFDPRTGRSPEELASVSVVADTAMQADALSTAVFVLGLEQGARLLQSLSGCEALLATKDGTIRATPGFPLEAT